MEIIAALSSFPIAALAADAGWREKIAYQINGLAVVFIALGTIWGAMEFIGWLFRVAARAAALRSARAAASVPAGAGEIPAETVAVISAAVSVALGAEHVIRAISPADHDPAWAREGRREVFHSHRIR